MLPHRDFRFLADRVEIDFHRRPNLLYRRIWQSSAVLGAIALLLALLPLVRGTTAVYAAGPVSWAHHMIENDCASCHQHWTLLARLNPFASSQNSSIDNGQCLACHEAAAHHARQIPAHADLSCAECHREHRGRQELAQMTDAQCIRCHEDLSQHGGSERFQNHLAQFDGDRPGGHPDFALERLLGRSTAGQPPLYDWDKFKNRDDRGLQRDSEGKFIDRGRIRFNHAVHLHARYEPADGGQQNLVEGLLDENRRLVDLSRDCQACHEPELDGRYMRPIAYERHCARCHPLYFDNGGFPGETVPHREPTIVLGFLVERYSRKLLRDSPAANESEPDPFADPPPQQPWRLPVDEARKAQETADQQLSDMPPPLHPFVPRFAETRLKSAGGCRYCHEVTQPEAEALWKIEQPAIPKRWFLHGEFDHQSHRMVDCGRCHQVWNEPASPPQAVNTSHLTADVLIPGIAVCRECHAGRPTVRGLARSAQIQGAGTNCVECHRYHAPTDPLKNHLGDGSDAPPEALWKPRHDILPPLRRE